MTKRDIAALQGGDRVHVTSWGAPHAKQIRDTTPNEVSQASPPPPGKPEIASLVKTQERKNDVFVGAPRDVVGASHQGAVFRRGSVGTGNQGLRVLN